MRCKRRHRIRDRTEQWIIGVALLSPTIEGSLINLRERRVEQKTRYQVRMGNKRFTERDGVDFVLSDRRLCARLIVAVISNVKPKRFLTLA